MTEPHWIILSEHFLYSEKVRSNYTLHLTGIRYAISDR
jgi:hypothetical protein